MDILEYKGYHTRIKFISETCMLRGKIEGINDLVDFQSQDPTMIEQEFHNAVDEYLEFCAEVGKEPEREYKGTFNVRIAPELHKELAIYAFKNEESMNAVVEKAIEAYVHVSGKTEIQLQRTIAELSKTILTQNEFKGNYPGINTGDTGFMVLPSGMSGIHMSYKESGR